MICRLALKDEAVQLGLALAQHVLILIENDREITGHICLTALPTGEMLVHDWRCVSRSPFGAVRLFKAARRQLNGNEFYIHTDPAADPSLLRLYAKMGLSVAYVVHKGRLA